MSALAQHIARRIRHEGPLSVAQFMAEALSHPLWGYYTRHDPLGRGGDFITAPEISQMFGELIGLWCCAVWENLGQPEAVVLAELGPGRGTLMADALRAARLVPAFRQSVAVHLVETSPVLRRRAEATLAEAGVAPVFHASLETLPQQAPLLLIANEFFDALPVYQFEQVQGRWYERRIGLAPDQASKSEAAPSAAPSPTMAGETGAGETGAGAASMAAPVFVFQRRPFPGNPAVLLPSPASDGALPEGLVAECSPAGLALAEEIGRRVQRQGGAALIIDYGYEGEVAGARPPLGTLQAVRDHRRAEPLAAPGEADLTAHVDFSALAEAARQGGGASWGPVPQGLWLEALGIHTRAERLKIRAGPAQAATIDSALARLTEAEAMGTLFKVLAVTTADAPTPPGFPIREGDRP